MRNEERNQERVEISARAKKSGEDLLANQSQHARTKHRNPNHAGGASAYTLGLFSHRRTKNNFPGLTKAKFSPGSRLGPRQKESLVKERGDDRDYRHGDERDDSVELLQTVEIMQKQLCERDQQKTDRDQ